MGQGADGADGADNDAMDNGADNEAMDNGADNEAMDNGAVNEAIVPIEVAGDMLAPNVRVVLTNLQNEAVDFENNEAIVSDEEYNRWFEIWFRARFMLGAVLISMTNLIRRECDPKAKDSNGRLVKYS
jgi:hypothetical protein